VSSTSFSPLFTSVEKESATFEVVSEVLEAEVVVALAALAVDAKFAEQPLNARAARRVKEVALLIILLFFTGFPLCLGDYSRRASATGVRRM